MQHGYFAYLVFDFYASYAFIVPQVKCEFVEMCFMSSPHTHTGANSMPVCGAFCDGKSMSQGHCLGTYSSFPADLMHHLLGIGKKAYLLKLAFFFQVLKLNAETDQNASVPKRKVHAEPAEATRKSSRFATPASARD